MQITSLRQMQNAAFRGYKHTKKAKQKSPEQKNDRERLLSSTHDFAAKNNTAAAKARTAPNIVTTPISELEFRQGIAARDYELFSGTAEYVSKNGDRYLLKYKRGRIVKATKNADPKTGIGDAKKDNYVKTYRLDGNKFVTTRKKYTKEGIEKSFCRFDIDEVYRENALGQVAYTTFENGIAVDQQLFDGTLRYWYQNGQLAAETLPDETEREWLDNGVMECEKLPDGTITRWYSNGQKGYEKLPDGTERSWSANGKMTSESLSDGTKRKWRITGQIESQEFPDGTKRKWYENGQMSYEKLPDGTIRHWYENGQLWVEALPDRSTRHWSEDGQKTFEALPDGTRKEWDKNGNLIKTRERK